MFIEVVRRLVISGEFEIDISKIFRHFRLPLIWNFFKGIAIATASAKFNFFWGGLSKFVHPNSAPTVPLVKKALQLCTKICLDLQCA
jgi:hypothetical protein